MLAGWDVRKQVKKKKKKKKKKKEKDRGKRSLYSLPNCGWMVKQFSDGASEWAAFSSFLPSLFIYFELRLLRLLNGRANVRRRRRRRRRKCLLLGQELVGEGERKKKKKVDGVVGRLVGGSQQQQHQGHQHGSSASSQFRYSSSYIHLFFLSPSPCFSIRQGLGIEDTLSNSVVNSVSLLDCEREPLLDRT